MGEKRITGLDVSGYQPHVDWSMVAAAGHKFVFVKATEGAGLVDGCYSQHKKGARDAGLLVGSYHFLRWEPGAPSGEAQAEHFASVIGRPKPGELMPVVDVEWIRGQRRPANEIVACVRSFLERIEVLTGRWPMVYTGPSFWRYCVLPAGKAALELTSWPLWEVDYVPPLDPMAGAPNWRPLFHQWTGSGTCPGIPNHVDLNYFSGSKPELEALAGLSGGE